MKFWTVRRLNPEVKHSAEFENRLPECTHSAEFNPKLLKAIVQKFRHFAEKFKNRLLGPTNLFKEIKRDKRTSGSPSTAV
jgi:hypothetical protein